MKDETATIIASYATVFVLCVLCLMIVGLAVYGLSMWIKCGLPACSP